MTLETTLEISVEEIISKIVADSIFAFDYVSPLVAHVSLPLVQANLFYDYPSQTASPFLGSISLKATEFGFVDSETGATVQFISPAFSMMQPLTHYIQVFS